MPTRYAEIVGTNYRNKGAELMLRAITARLNAPDSPVEPVARLRPGRYGEQRQFGLKQKIALPRFDVVARHGGGLVPIPLRRRLGLVTDTEIDVVMDASGFAYSDQWGLRAVSYLARRAERLERRGAKLVLLPQALGPFRSTEAQVAFRRCLNTGALVFARDARSMEYASDVTRRTANLRMAPDFTCLLAPTPAAVSAAAGPYGCVVPNARMIDKVATMSWEAYVAAIARGVHALHKHGLKVFVVPFDYPGDVDLCWRIAALTGGTAVTADTDALSLKQLIGGAEIVVGSRYHALVSALSQAVPAVGSSWSHKYHALFQDYQCVDFLAPDLSNPRSLEDRVHQALEDNANGALSARLAAAALEQRRTSNAMWYTVMQYLDSGVSTEPFA